MLAEMFIYEVSIFLDIVVRWGIKYNFNRLKLLVFFPQYNLFQSP